MRGDYTPIAVAYADPVLRAAGMETDSYGEAKRFFELTDHQLHNLVYYCHFGAHVSAAPVARRLRSMAARNPQRQGLRFLGLSRNWLAPLVIVAGALLLLFGAYL